MATYASAMQQKLLEMDEDNSTTDGLALVTANQTCQPTSLAQPKVTNQIPPSITIDKDVTNLTIKDGAGVALNPNETGALTELGDLPR